MNTNQYNKLRAIAERLNSDYLNLGVSSDYRTIKDTWNGAVYYNRMQKQMESYEVVRTLQVMDLNAGEVNGFNIRNTTQYSRMQWFLINILYDNYATLQDIKKALKEFKF